MVHEGEIGRGVRVAVPALHGGARRRRTLDQRLYVRLPALYQVLADAFSRLPRRSRFRRLMLARTVALAYAAANRRDFDAVLVGWDPGGEYRPSPDLMPPDFKPAYRGHDEYRRFWRNWLDAIGDIRWEPEAILDFGDTFVVTAEQRGHGSGSGVPVKESVFQLFELRRGLVVRQQDFLDHSEAIEAASRQQ